MSSSTETIRRKGTPKKYNKVTRSVRLYVVQEPKKRVMKDDVVLFIGKVFCKDGGLETITVDSEAVALMLKTNTFVVVTDVQVGFFGVRTLPTSKVSLEKNLVLISLSLKFD